MVKFVTILMPPLTKKYGDNDQLKATLYSEDGTALTGKTIHFTINGVTYPRTTNSEGVARLNIKLRPGVYYATAEFKGDGEYGASTHPNVKVTVKYNTRIEGTNITKKHSEVSVYQCAIYDDFNNRVQSNVSITVNGVTYICRTNNDGLAKLNIRLGQGDYTITSKYDGDDLHEPSTVVNTIRVNPDIETITQIKDNLSIPSNNNAQMKSHIYLTQVPAEKKASAVYDDYTAYDYIEGKTDIYFTEYEITETDGRVKTAKFTTPNYIDLTTGRRYAHIVNPYHENFGGQILKVDYNKSNGVYTYQCQDGRRQYLSKRRTMLKGTKTTIYEILEALLVNPLYVRSGNGNIPITNQDRMNGSVLLSGLRPITDYNLKFSPVTVKRNAYKEICPAILSYDSTIDKITTLAHHGSTPVDVYFDAKGICQIEPIDLDKWLTQGIRLVHSDLINYNYGFDITNVITGVSLKHATDNSASFKYDEWNDLRFYFGANFGMIDPVTTSTEETTTNTQTSNNSGSSIMSGKKTFVVGCDGGTNISTVNDVINALKAKGHTCINVGKGPSVITNYGLKSASKGKIAIFICNGIDGGNFYDYIQSYYHYDHMILMYESNKATTDKWITCNGMKNTKLYIDPRQGYSRVVYNSGVQNYTANEWCKKYSDKLSYVCGPLGCKWSDVVSNLVNGKFNGDNGVNTTTTSTSSTNSTGNTVIDTTATYNKALEAVSESIRDLLSFEIELPLNNPIFKNLHTNQMLWTELPADFKLKNLTEIFKILPTYKVNRGIPYMENRWYIEKQVITCNENGLKSKLTLNPFPSSYSTYTNAIKSYQEAFSQAFETNNTTSVVTRNTNTARLGNDSTSTNNMRCMSGGGYGNSGHGKNFDSCSEKGYAQEGKAYYTWARQYKDVISLLKAISNRFSYLGYSNNQRSVDTVHNNGGTVKANCYDAARYVKCCCDSAGFPCVVITGSIWQGGHGWNAVKYNGTWYTFDLCYASKGTSTNATNSLRGVW